MLVLETLNNEGGSTGGAITFVLGSLVNAEEKSAKSSPFLVLL